MAVYKRHYEAYGGPLTKRWRRFLVVTRYAMNDLFRSRFFMGFFVLSLVPVLGFAGYIFIVNNGLLRLVLAFNAAAMLPVEAMFFVMFLELQTSLAFLLACWIGPTLVAGDLTNGALPLFLSRPLSRAEYVAGKFAVLGILLSFVTWVPGLLLLLLEAGLGPRHWLGHHLWLIGPILWCSILWMVLISLIVLAVSAWVKWRILAMALIFGIYLIPSVFGEVLNVALRTNWGNLLNLSFLITEIVLPGFRVVPTRAGWVPAPAAWAMLAAVCLVCLRLLHSRLRAFEVVRG